MSKNRRLVAIMFTDIVGYTALMQEDEALAAAARAKHRQVFEEVHQTYHGEILQYFGDGTLSVFQSGVEAVECAMVIQKQLMTGDTIPLRIGLHIGDIVFDGTEIYGDGVNVASRIESMGVAGAILLSGKLNDDLKNQQQISTKSLGHFDFKNIKDPVEVFAVSNEGINFPDHSELKGKQKQTTKTIAVLPFVNMSSNEENEYFCDGMTEEIINALAKIKGLRVTSRTSSFFFKNKKRSIRQVGEELNVSTILEGSIRLSGNKMRITAQLIDVAEDFHFWSETFDRSIDDIFAVQDEISLLIADKLREHIGHFEIEDHLIDAKDVSVEIYKRYLKSRYHLLKMTKPDLEKGMSLLEEIIEEQPDFALAHLGMHLGYTLQGMLGLLPAYDAFTKGQPFLDKAIVLDENLPECQLHLSYDAFLQKWDFPAAYRHLKKSFDIRPTVEYYQSMASTLVAERKFAAAANYIETALQLDPFSEINYHLKGFILFCREDYSKAIECFKKAVELKPGFIVSTVYWGQALLLMGKEKEGLSFFENLPEDDGDLTKLSYTTLAYISAGETALAEAGVAKLKAALDTDLAGMAVNSLMLCYASQGDQEATIDMIERGIALRLPMMVYVYAEPIFKPLHGIPRFQELVKQLLGEGTSFDISTRKYKKSLLDEKLIEEYKAQLESLMSTSKPYLDPNLTLRDLARMMDLPANHLSQLLSEGFDKNFSTYINTYRLETFKAKIVDPALQHLTILALAYESGFNSKTVFNSFFKKVMGMTPKAYLRSMREKL